jgi:hypothetical protein
MLFVPLFDRQAEADEVLALLRRAGYHLYDWYNFAYNDRGQLLFGDAIFLSDYPTRPLLHPPPDSVRPSQPEPASATTDKTSLDMSGRHDGDQTIAHLRQRVVELKQRIAGMREKLRARDAQIDALKSAQKPGQG